MARRRLKKKESLTKSESKSTVLAEVNLEEARKDLLESEFTLYEHKPALQMHPRSSDRDENQLDPWYFTHV